MVVTNNGGFLYVHSYIVEKLLMEGTLYRLDMQGIRHVVVTRMEVIIFAN